MATEASLLTQIQKKDSPANAQRLFALGQFATRTLLIATFALFVYGLAWNISTRRYLKGFTDAILPLEGSEQEKTEALLRWFREEPQRLRTPVTDSAYNRDPVIIVKNRRLLKICGSATNAFINLGKAAGLKTRRLLLVDKFGNSMHVVAEVRWDDRWVAVNPQQGRVFKDHLGRALSKEELRDPAVFHEAISLMPGYNPKYTFERTIHIRLSRIPFGLLLRIILDRYFPGWEEAADWGYIPENPSLWPILVSIPLFYLGILVHLSLRRYGRNKLGIEAPGLRQRLKQAGRAFLLRSA